MRGADLRVTGESAHPGIRATLRNSWNRLWLRRPLESLTGSFREGIPESDVSVVRLTGRGRRLEERTLLEASFPGRFGSREDSDEVTGRR